MIENRILYLKMIVIPNEEQFQVSRTPTVFTVPAWCSGYSVRLDLGDSSSNPCVVMEACRMTLAQLLSLSLTYLAVLL